MLNWKSSIPLETLIKKLEELNRGESIEWNGSLMLATVPRSGNGDTLDTINKPTQVFPQSIIRGDLLIIRTELGYSFMTPSVRLLSQLLPRHKTGDARFSFQSDGYWSPIEKDPNRDSPWIDEGSYARALIFDHGCGEARLYSTIVNF